MSTAGPNNPTVASGALWTNPTGVKGASTFATFVESFGNSDNTGTLIGTSLGFSIPAGTINGITCVLARKYSKTGVGTPALNTFNAQLLKGGVATGTPKGTGANWTTSNTDETWGSSSDLWGATLSASDVNGSGFGFQINAVVDASGMSSGSATASVQNFRITVTYTTSTGAVTTQSILIGF